LSKISKSTLNFCYVQKPVVHGNDVFFHIHHFLPTFVVNRPIYINY